MAEFGFRMFFFVLKKCPHDPVRSVKIAVSLSGVVEFRSCCTFIYFFKKCVLLLRMFVYFFFCFFFFFSRIVILYTKLNTKIRKDFYLHFHWILIIGIVTDLST